MVSGRTGAGDMERCCPLEALGLRGLLWLSWTPWAVHFGLPHEGWPDQPPVLVGADSINLSSNPSTNKTAIQSAC